MIRINQIRLPLGYSDRQLRDALVRKARIHPGDLISYKILRESIDARKRRGSKQSEGMSVIISAAAEIKNENALLKKNRSADVQKYEPKVYKFPYVNDRHLKTRPVVIGSGPAGLFCALTLARAGFAPLLLERGSEVRTRTSMVQDFWNGAPLDPNTNVQFGEGGAGTFSDGKLNTMVKDPSGLHMKVLEEFAAAGAPSEILYRHKPHLGTDTLASIVENIRNEIIRLGGEVRFNSCVTDFSVTEKSLRSVTVNNAEHIRSDCAVLAVGHSARDTFEKLLGLGMDISQKPFAVGVRIEHPQEMIDISQYGMRHPPCGPADYKLTYHTAGGRSVYTFCMCPGGWVVNASSQDGGIVVNGMSLSARDSLNANSAVVVGVNPSDFGSSHPLAGAVFQRKIEELAYAEGRGNVPVQLFEDFREKKVSTGFGEVMPVHKGSVRFGNIRDVLPDYICVSLIEGIDGFSSKIHGFNRPDAIISGVETRTSSPVRMNRGSDMQSNIRGIIPCGEGAGYAGGITSAAMDGIRAAQAAAEYIQNNC